MAGIFDVFTGQSGVDAANAQIAGIQSGQTAANASLASGRGALTTGATGANNALTSNYTSALQPFLQNFGQAQQGTTALSNALGLNGGPAGATAAANAYASNPAYEFQLNQGNQNVLRNQAQTGTLASGATLNALQQQGQGQAQGTYQQYINNLQPFLGAQGSAASGIANTYTGLGSGLAGVSTGLGSALNQNFGSQANLGYTAATGIGNANANADLAQGKGIANLWNAGLGVAGMFAGLPPGTIGNTFSAANNNTSLPSGSFDGLAAGGPADQGKPYVVGERGPELFVPQQSGTVVPNQYASKFQEFLKPQGTADATPQAQQVGFKPFNPMNPAYSNPGGHQAVPASTGQTAGAGRTIPGVHGPRVIGGGGLNDPPGPKELAESIWQTNNGKLKSSLQEIGRMQGSIGGRHPYNAEELSETESHLRSLATKPFVSQADQDAAAEAKHDATDRAFEGESLDYTSPTAKRKPKPDQSSMAIPGDYASKFQRFLRAA